MNRFVWILQKFEQWGNLAGINVFARHWNGKKKAYRIFCTSAACSLFLAMICFVFIEHHSLLLAVINGALAFYAMIATKFGYYDLTHYANELSELLNWCKDKSYPKVLKNYPAQRTVFNKILIELNEKCFQRALHMSEMILKGSIIFLACIYSSVITFTTIFSCFTDNGYILPVPFYLPYFKPDNFGNFLINYLFQCWTVVYADSALTIYCGILMVIVQYIFAQLNLMLDVTKAVHMNLAQNFGAKVNFYEFINSFVDLHCEVNQ